MTKKREFKSVCSDLDQDASRQIISDYREGKKHLVVTPKKGEAMDTCATIHEQYVCCNVKVLKSVSNCPFDCSYCFLQNYLNDGTTKVVGDTAALMAEVHEKTAAQPWRFFRIGTWELGDSLALEEEVGQASQLIEAFKDVPNAVLELKTKSDVVDPIIGLDHQHKTVVSWSMSPAAIIDSQEHRTASLEERLIAIEKVVKDGYLVGFHFDPMIVYPNWESDYRELAKTILSIAPANQIAWISMGSLRFNPEMKRTMEMNFPASELSLAEMVLGSDGKMRYVKPLRTQMYQSLYQSLQDHADGPLFLYLCMERWDVWDAIFGSHPDSIGHLDYLFADSMRARFPQLAVPEPDLVQYKAHQSS